MIFAAHSDCHYQLGAGRDAPPIPDASTLRAEDAARPTAGDLIAPGAVVSTSYGTGPYLVHRITPVIYYGAWRAWSLLLIPNHPVHGFVLKTSNLAYINELVVDWQNGSPRFRKLFLANPDEVFISEERAFQQTRSGQMTLF